MEVDRVEDEISEENIVDDHEVSKNPEEKDRIDEVETTVAQCSDETNSKETNNKTEYDEKQIVETVLNKTNDSSVGDFKKPVLLIGPRKGHPTKLKIVTHNKTTEVPTDLEENSSNAEIIKEESTKYPQKTEKSPASNLSSKEQKISLPYTEPSWSGKPDQVYKFEVLKSGLILETINISEENFYVVGRLPSCHISLAHPTISRYHAIIQYRIVGDDKNGKGMYVYDLGSTHGTFWNGNRIRPKVYVRLQGGHMLKFGCSQRKFILQAPPDDQEEESEYTVSELKEMRRLELEERQRVEKLRLMEEEEQERLRKEKEENEGIDWGMGEDADEETDLTENPYAQTNNEELFLDDPKKTLRGWFEREGHDLQYNTEDKGIGRFLCWVELPIDDGRLARAEALVTGKKKEAVVQCALEACRILDRHGLLRQANHEARKRKTRNWEEEDFYDSDEDNFLDRTGTIEKKREQRMKMAGKLETKAETYDSLLEKHTKVAEKITSIENAIALQKAKQEEIDDSNVDALDAFMSTLDTSALNKTEIRKMKMELLNLRKEEMQLLKLINIAKPANLPPLKPHIPNIGKKLKTDFKDKSIIVGHKNKMKHLTEKREIVTEATEEDNSTNLNEDTRIDSENVSSKLIDENVRLTDDETNTGKNENSSEDKCTLFALKTENSIINDSKNNEEAEKELIKKKKRNSKRNQQRLDKTAKELQKGYDDEEYREDYDMWVPPTNQSGDGKTSLNEKFGY